MAAILAQGWQKINVLLLFCHSWRDLDGAMITAMTFLLILTVIAVALAARTIDLLLHDGRGPAAPPSSHFQDPRFAAPGAGR
jgi:hypothetical protein